MRINIKEHVIIRFQIEGLGLFYCDRKMNTINGKKAEFGDERQADLVRIVQERGLSGRAITDWEKTLAPFVGKTFGTKTNRGKKRMLKFVSKNNQDVLTIEKHKEVIMSVAEFYNWLRKDHIFLLN